MRNAPGELSDHLHFLGLPQSFLGFFALRNLRQNSFMGA